MLKFDELERMHSDFVKAVTVVVANLREHGGCILIGFKDFDEEDIAGIAETAAQELGQSVYRVIPNAYSMSVGFLIEKPYRVNVPSVIGVATPITDVWNFIICEDD